MAISMNSGDSSGCSSPRFSFSRDIPEGNSSPSQSHHQEANIIRLDKSLLFDQANFEFNFCVTSHDAEKDAICPADELFFNGVIIPTQMREKLNSSSSFCSKGAEAEAEKEITSMTTATLVREDKSTSRSFWRFKRSSSLNCDNGDYYGHKKSSIWSNLPLLLRSKSTGSSALSSSNHKPCLNQSKSTKKPSNSSSSSTMLPSHQKPPMKKNGYAYGVFINGGSYVNNNNNCGKNYPPVLNVPSPYIAKGTSDLLGLGTLFRNGSKDKRSKK